MILLLFCYMRMEKKIRDIIFIITGDMGYDVGLVLSLSRFFPLGFLGQSGIFFRGAGNAMGWGETHRCVMVF